MRIAVLADVHGNLPALRATLDAVSSAAPDAIVLAGDIAGGPYVRECLELLATRPEALHAIAGNCEREAVAAFDGAETGDDPAGRAAAFTARSLDRSWRDRMAAWPVSLALPGVRICHGSPRRDDELLTSRTPEPVIRAVLSDVGEPLVVGGHTHRSFIREIDGGPTLANAGSVGLPYEGRPGAFWMLIDDGEAELRRVTYDLEAAVAELRRAGYPDLEETLDGSLLNPYDPDWVAASFEHAAGRAPDPGEPRRVSRVR